MGEVEREEKEWGASDCEVISWSVRENLMRVRERERERRVSLL